MLSLVKCPPETFDAVIYVAIFMAVKETPAPSHKYQSGAILFPGYVYQELGTVGYGAVNKTSGHKLLFASSMLKLYQRMVEQHEKVKKYLSILDTGIHSGNVRAKIFFAENTSGQLSRLLQGRQIGRFCMN